jgi:hypothetical protein
MQTYLCDKMPPQKVTTKKQKKWYLAKLEKRFLILSFWGGICHKDKFFLNQYKILNFLIPYITYWKKKNFTSQIG